MRSLILTILLFTLSVICGSARDIVLLKGGAGPPEKVRSQQEISTMPVRTVDVAENGTVTVTYEFNAMYSDPDDLYVGTVALGFDGFGQNTTLNEGQWPLRQDMVGCPPGTTPVVKLVDSEYVEIPIQLSPAREMLSDSSSETYSFETVPPITVVDQFLPANIVNLRCTKDIHQNVQIFPARTINERD